MDPATLFEFSRDRSNMYKWNPESACLVDADDEPPHPPNKEALETTILISELLHSNVVDEIHVMRKIVIDGSNTAGFQRTAVIGLGGRILVDGKTVGVQSITVEEDSCRILGEDERSRYFALDRLGTPLVEIALEPVTGTPEWVESVALHLGRSLRSTGRVARGLGTIRQDLNVSTMGGNVVEVKGVQKLNLLSKVLRYEVSRQMGLAQVSDEVKRRGLKSIRTKTKEVTQLLAKSDSKVLQKIIAGGGSLVCLSAEGLAGLLGMEPYPGIRLGKELAEIARANGLGGVIHSDEFPKQGISVEDARRLREAMKVDERAGLVIVGGERRRVETGVSALLERIDSVMTGVPAETRAATDMGETRYMRPRPGAARMYPETDIPEIVVTPELTQKLSRLIPRPWAEQVKEYQDRYSLSPDLALQVYDSQNSSLFEKLARGSKLKATTVASVLVELPVRLAREGVPEDRLTSDILTEVLHALERGLVAKEALPEILRAYGRGEVDDIESAIQKLGLKPLSKEGLTKVIDEVLKENDRLLKERGETAFSPLMGEVMKRVRGRVDGGLVSKILRERLEAARKHAKKVK